MIYDQAMKEEELVQVLYRIPKSDRRALNIRAAEQDMSTTELVRQLIRQYLADQRIRQGV